jgi:hypothetical protein
VKVVVAAGCDVARVEVGKDGKIIVGRKLEQPFYEVADESLP